MGKYDTIDREFFREPEHAAEIITNTVYRGRFRVLPQDLSRIPEKCKESKDKRTELERDALFLCKKHTVKYGLEVENYADYAMPKEFVGSDPIKFPILF